MLVCCDEVTVICMPVDSDLRVQFCEYLVHPGASAQYSVLPGNNSCRGLYRVGDECGGYIATADVLRQRSAHIVEDGLLVGVLWLWL